MKRLLSIVLVFVFLLQFNVFAEEIKVDATSSILMEASTGEILYEHNAYERVHIASVTKVMTMLLIVEEIDAGRLSMDDIVTTSEYAESMGGSQIYLEVGEKMSVHDMLKAIAVASANDASVAMSEHIEGSEEAFIKRMNERAKELGMENTNFVNSNGLDEDNQYSTAYDVAIMSKELISHEIIRPFLTIWMDSLRGGEFQLANTNKLVSYYDGILGIKTGSTSGAKFCLSAAAERNDLGLISVVLGAPTPDLRFSESEKLLDFGFANYRVEKCVEKDEVLGKVKVKKGELAEIDVVASEKFNAVLSKKQTGEITKKVVLPEKIKAPVAAGEKIGDVIFMSGETEIGSIDIVAKQEVKKKSYFRIFSDLLKKWIFLD